MLNKKKLHHWLVIIRHIKVWQLLLVLAALLVLSAYLLRQNNLGMIDTRERVKTADANNQNIKESLRALQSYVSGHMNASLGDGVFLDKSYVRDYQARLQAAATTQNPNSALYAEVERQCRPLRAQGGYVPYTQCAHDKLSTIAPGTDAFAAVQPPPVALYTYNFYSPLWSADWAGLAVAATIIVALLLLARLLSYISLRILLRIRR